MNKEKQSKSIFFKFVLLFMIIISFFTINIALFINTTNSLEEKLEKHRMEIANCEVHSSSILSNNSGIEAYISNTGMLDIKNVSVKLTTSVYDSKNAKRTYTEHEIKFINNLEVNNVKTVEWNFNSSEVKSELDYEIIISDFKLYNL